MRSQGKGLRTSERNFRNRHESGAKDACESGGGVPPPLTKKAKVVVAKTRKSGGWTREFGETRECRCGEPGRTPQESVALGREEVRAVEDATVTQSDLKCALMIYLNVMWVKVDETKHDFIGVPAVREESRLTWFLHIDL